MQHRQLRRKVIFKECFASPVDSKILHEKAKNRKNLLSTNLNDQEAINLRDEQGETKESLFTPRNNDSTITEVKIPDETEVVEVVKRFRHVLNIDAESFIPCRTLDLKKTNLDPDEVMKIIDETAQQKIHWIGRKK